MSLPPKNWGPQAPQKLRLEALRAQVATRRTGCGLGLWAWAVGVLSGWCMSHCHIRVGRAGGACGMEMVVHAITDSDAEQLRYSGWH